MLGVGDYVRLGTTVDDAIGEAFDKTAKLLGLGYPGGPQVEKEALARQPARFALPRPMLGRPNADFSLSGLKTALRLEAEKIAPLQRRGRARPLRLVPAGVVDVVVRPAARRTCKMFRERYGTPTALVAAGGVAANEAIRKVLHRIAFEAGTVLVVPPPELCTDNGAMIAWAGRRAAGARPDRYARRRAARALAARRGDRARRRPAPDVASRQLTGARMTFDRISPCSGAGAWGSALANVAARAGRR